MPAAGAAPRPPRPGLDDTATGRLTDEPGTGMVTLATHGPYGQVPRADVAAVGLGVLDRPATDRVLEVVSGTEAVEAALDAATRTAD